jgi:hypothetical protein
MHYLICMNGETYFNIPAYCLRPIRDEILCISFYVSIIDEMDLYWLLSMFEVLYFEAVIFLT